jgi:hypothetical protein
LARLSIDRALRDRLFTAPAKVGEELGLAAEESLGLARLSRRQLEQFADSLRRKRRNQVRRVVPTAARALGQNFATLFERYIAESPPRGSKADLDDAAGFVAALCRWADQLQPEWVADVCRYELAWRQASRAGRFPILRTFRFPVDRLVSGQQPRPVARRATVAIWWRPARLSAVWHFVITMPLLHAAQGRADAQRF